MTKKTKENWVTTKVRRTLSHEIEKALYTDEAKKEGLTNLSQFVDSAIRELLEKLETSRFTHINTYDDKIRISDDKIGRFGDIVTVFLRDNEKNGFCDHCESHKCIHVKYMWELPDIVKILKKRGFISPYNDFIDNSSQNPKKA